MNSFQAIFRNAFVTVIFIFGSLSGLRAEGGIVLNFVFTNNHGNSVTLCAGLDAMATNGINPGIGETELPPLPPSEIFDARFLSPGSAIKLGEGTHTDLRIIQSQTVNFTEEYKISFQAGKTYKSGTLILQKSFPMQIAQLRIDGKAMKAGDSIVTQFNSGEMIIDITYNLLPVTFTLTPSSITFRLSNLDRTLPVPDTVLVTPSVAGASWNIETDEPWIALSATSGSGQSKLIIGLTTLIFLNGSTSGQVRFRSSADDPPTVLEVNVDFTTGTVNLADPLRCALEQNYPNPFGKGSPSRSATTTFCFFISESTGGSAYFRFSLYDALGRKVAGIAEGVFGTGSHSITFDGSDLDTGLYFLTFEGAGARLIKKALIIK